jgi:A/G-specific adenine glycosylase
MRMTDDNDCAYRVLVSEVMLQQTQVPRVEIVFKRFLQQFPTLKHLAKATNAQIIMAWRGMGYNSRALRLRDAAKHIIEERNGVFPRELDELLSIKGIGSYTAAAIRNFAFNLPTVCIDTNIRRILHRIFIGPENIYGAFSAPDRELEPIAETSLRIGLDAADHSASTWHAALMDFGSLVCTKRSPKCDICPMAKNNLCLSAFKVPVFQRDATKKQEPGRLTGGKHVPNRIFRGRIVEALRDATDGLLITHIGPIIAIDWNTEKDLEWLTSLLEKLISDHLIIQQRDRFLLRQ